MRKKEWFNEKNINMKNILWNILLINKVIHLFIIYNSNNNGWANNK